LFYYGVEGMGRVGKFLYVEFQKGWDGGNLSFGEIWRAVRFHAYDISIALSLIRFNIIYTCTSLRWDRGVVAYDIDQNLSPSSFLLFSFPYFFLRLVTRFTSIFISFRLSLF